MIEDGGLVGATIDQAAGTVRFDGGGAEVTSETKDRKAAEAGIVLQASLQEHIEGVVDIATHQPH